jgi:hypothetical protein
MRQHVGDDAGAAAVSAVFLRLRGSMPSTSSISGALVLTERRHRLPRRFLQTRARRSA